MTRKDFPGFSRIVIGLAELRGKQLSAQAIELYWRTMQHWTYQEFATAAEQLLRTTQFMPTPKDFEDLRHRAVAETAAEEWVEILTRARSGNFVLTGLSSAARLAVTAVGGIQAVAMSDTSKTHFIEKRFSEHYHELQDAYVARSGHEAIAHLERDTGESNAIVRSSNHTEADEEGTRRGHGKGNALVRTQGRHGT